MNKYDYKRFQLRENIKKLYSKHDGVCHHLILDCVAACLGISALYSSRFSLELINKVSGEQSYDYCINKALGVLDE